MKLEIQSNRDIELMKFSRGEIQLINTMDADYFDRLSASSPALVHDAGASLDSEQMWFNQVSPRAHSRLQAAVVHLAQFPARDFVGHQSRGPVQSRVQRSRATGAWSGLASQQILVQRSPATAPLRPTRSPATSPAGRLPAFRRTNSAITTATWLSSPSSPTPATARGSGWRR